MPLEELDTQLITERVERIECPECGTEQDAVLTLEDGNSFMDYTHTCEYCGYVITEDEWQRVEDR